MKVNEIEKAVYNFIDIEPRSRKEIISFIKNRKFTSHITGDKVIKGLLKNGRLSFEIAGKERIYSVVGDPRLQYLAEKIAVYDINDHRIKRIAQYWGKFEIKEITVEPDEVCGEVKSFTSDDWYVTSLEKDGDCYCSCMGFHDVPCSHILALAINQDKIGWLP